MWALRFFKTTPTVFSYKGLFPQANFAFEPHRHSHGGDCTVTADIRQVPVPQD